MSLTSLLDVAIYPVILTVESTISLTVSKPDVLCFLTEEFSQLILNIIIDRAMSRSLPMCLVYLIFLPLFKSSFPHFDFALLSLCIVPLDCSPRHSACFLIMKCHLEVLFLLSVL